MARIRTIKPEFFDSGSLAKISRDARLTFAGLFTLVDDEGHMRYLPKKIAGELYPYDDDVDASTIACWVDDLISVGAVVAYRVGYDEFLAIPSWKDHQRIDHPTASRLPAPSDGTILEIQQVGASFGAPPENFANDSGTTPETFSPDLGSGKGSRKGKGKGIKNMQQPKIENDFSTACVGEITDVSIEESKAQIAVIENHKPRARDPIWDALQEIMPIDSSMTLTERGRCNKAVGLLRQSGATRDQILARALEYRMRYPRAAFTWMALANRWGELANALPEVDQNQVAIARFLQAEGES